MRTVWTHDGHPLHRQFVDWASAKLFGNLRGFGPCVTMGVVDGSNLAAVMVYHNLDRKAGVIEISGASETREWLKRHVLWEMFSYPFEEQKCQLVVMRVSERNVMWNGRGLPRLLKAYGFTSTYIPRLRGRDEGEYIWTLADDVWRANGFHSKSPALSPDPVQVEAA